MPPTTHYTYTTLQHAVVVHVKRTLNLEFLHDPSARPDRHVRDTARNWCAAVRAPAHAASSYARTLPPARLTYVQRAVNRLFPARAHDLFDYVGDGSRKIRTQSGDVSANVPASVLCQRLDALCAACPEYIKLVDAYPAYLRAQRVAARLEQRARAYSLRNAQRHAMYAQFVSSVHEPMHRSRHRRDITTLTSHWLSSTPTGVPLNVLETVTTLHVVGATDVPVTCSVCLDTLHTGDIVREVVGCGHRYHPACLAGWLHRHRTCPNCRGIIG